MSTGIVIYFKLIYSNCMNEFIDMTLEQINEELDSLAAWIDEVYAQYGIE